MKSISGSATTALLGAQKNESCFPELTFRQRMEGFLVCFVLGTDLLFYLIATM